MQASEEDLSGESEALLRSVYAVLNAIPDQPVPAQIRNQVGSDTTHDLMGRIYEHLSRMKNQGGMPQNTRDFREEVEQIRFRAGLPR